MTERVTLRDVAREAGVHTSTASRALNIATRDLVKEATATRVLEAARRLAYRPHAPARGLRTRRTMTVGMVVPDLENPLFPPIVRGVEAAVATAGYSLLVGNTDNDEFRLRTVVGSLLSQNVDGLVLATARVDDAVIAQLIDRGVRLVLVNRHSDGIAVNAVVADDGLGIALAVDHLRELGHEQIGHVAGPRWLATGRDRADAFAESLAGHGVETDESAVEEATLFQIDPGRKAAAALLERRPDLTAVVAGNDLLALGCYLAIRDRGRDVPGDISVTGYNDMPLVDMVQPPLTTVRVHYREMGRMGGSVLLDLLTAGDDDPETEPGPILLTPTLQVRSSTGPARRRDPGAPGVDRGHL